MEATHGGMPFQVTQQAAAFEKMFDPLIQTYNDCLSKRASNSELELCRSNHHPPLKRVRTLSDT